MDTTRNTFAALADEPTDDAASHESTDAAQEATSRPYTLEEAHEVCRHERDRWISSFPPTGEDWGPIRFVLERAERASQALLGLSNLLNDHRFAKDQARDERVPLQSFNDFQEGCLVEAQEVLLSVVGDALADLKKAACGVEE